MYNFDALVNAFGIGCILGVITTALIAKEMYKGDK